MKRRLLSCLKGLQSGSRAALVLAFLLLPYVVDVAYYGDFTAVHFAHQNSKDTQNEEEDLFADGPTSSFLVEHQANPRAQVGLLPSDLHASRSHEAEPVLTREHLLITQHISRPPPIR